MRKSWLPLALLPFLLSLPTAAQADGGPEQAAVARAPASAQARLKRQLQAHGAEVTRLQNEVNAQETHSLQASEHLRDQDREIAQLRRQLEALDASPPPDAPGH